MNDIDCFQVHGRHFNLRPALASLDMQVARRNEARAVDRYTIGNGWGRFRHLRVCVDLCLLMEVSDILNDFGGPLKLRGALLGLSERVVLLPGINMALYLVASESVSLREVLHASSLVN